MSLDGRRGRTAARLARGRPTLALCEPRVGGVIKRPVEDVFRVLSNPENAPKWSLNALEEKLTSPPPVGVGSTRRAVVKSFGGRTAENWTANLVVAGLALAVSAALGWFAVGEISHGG